VLFADLFTYKSLLLSFLQSL